MGDIVRAIEGFVEEKFGKRPYVELSPVFEKLYGVGNPVPKVINRGTDVEIGFHVDEMKEIEKNE